MIKEICLLVVIVFKSINCITWFDCGGKDAIGKMTDIQMQPNPLKFGDWITISAAGELFRQFPVNTIGRIELWRIIPLLGVFEFALPILCFDDRCQKNVCEWFQQPRECNETMKVNAKYNLNVTCDCNTFIANKYAGYDYKYKLELPPRANPYRAFIPGLYRMRGMIFSPERTLLGCAWGQAYVTV